MVRALLDQVGDWPALVVLAVAALVLAVESSVLIGLLMPGTTTLVVLGLWSASSAWHPALPIAVAATASVGGALTGWRRGHGRRALDPGSHRRLRARVEPVVRTARSWLTRLGPVGTVAVLAGSHWIAGTRTLTPRVAGGAGVPLRLAGPVLVVSGTAWATTVILLSRALGERVATGAGWVAAVVLGVLVVALVVRSARAHHRRSAATGP
ncbi:DedA family protein [Modestobacter sp. SSW1-42]|uniref:DedA family protein n=1 Tax=Modestobacter sp. SSW1-42 TaxID=596372 RepID=UPI0039882F6E